MTGHIWKAALAAIALCCGTVAGAQEAEAPETRAPETKVGDDTVESPEASIYQLGWLIGQWDGKGIGGARAMESWLAPSGTTMVGTFVQETPKGGIRFTEHMYLMEQDGSLVLKLKHFNADLTGWEEKDDMLSFRLLALEPCAAFFNGLTLRCDGDNGLLVAVRMKSDKPEPQELIFRFTRAPRETPNYDCDGTTLEMNECMVSIFGKARARQNAYLVAALERHADRPELAKQIGASDVAFEMYRKAECGAVWEKWKEGTIRNMMSLSCSIGLTDKRTHDIWENWLTFADSTAPIKPEPGETR